MKSLKAIQVLAKIGKILSKIIFVFCIVGFCLCVAGIISLAIGLEGLKLGGTTIHGLIESETSMSMESLYGVMAVGAVFCVAEAVLSKFAEIYFRNELADGTPFTRRSAKELTRLGILTIAIPMAAAIICSIGVGIASLAYPEIETLPHVGGTSVGLGIMMIIASLFCRYGAELRGEKPEETPSAE